MALFVGQGFAQGLLPENASALAVDRENRKPVTLRDGQIVVVARRRAGLGRERLAKRDGGGEKNLILPNDRRRMASAGDLRLPANVPPRSFIPIERRIAERRYARSKRSSPLWPIGGCG